MFILFKGRFCEILRNCRSMVRCLIVCNRRISRSKECFRTMKAPWRILFFGSDYFSEASLKMLYGELSAGVLVSQLDVVTSFKSQANPVRTFSLQNNLCIHDWPLSSVTEEFDVGVAVSFGHLIPEKVIASFPLGILNVHASLLPRWRGAAPIIHALMHGDTVTGVSIMKIKPKKFDIGDVVKQKSCHIYPDETLPQLFNRLSLLGAEALIESLRELPDCLDRAVPQPHTNITYAPKVSPAVAAVRWQDMTSTQVYNLHRAVGSLYPLTTSWHGLPIKLYCISPYASSMPEDHCYKPGCVRYVRPLNVIQVVCADSLWVNIEAVGVPKKKALSAVEFFNGYLSKKKICDRVFT